MTVAPAARGDMVGMTARYLPDRVRAPRFARVCGPGTPMVNVAESGAAGPPDPVGAQHWEFGAAGIGLPGAPAAPGLFGCATIRWAEEGVDSYAVANVVIGVAARPAVTRPGTWSGQRVGS